MKSVGSAGLKGAFWATLVCDGVSGMVGVWAKAVVARRTVRRAERCLKLGLKSLMGDRVALM